MICRIQQIVLFKKLKITKAQEIMMRLSPKLSNDSKNMLMIIGFMRSWRIFICIKKISKKQRKSFIMRENYTQSQAPGFIYKDIFSWKNEIMNKLSKRLNKPMFYFPIMPKLSEVSVGVMS